MATGAGGGRTAVAPGPTVSAGCGKTAGTPVAAIARLPVRAGAGSRTAGSAAEAGRRPCGATVAAITSRWLDQDSKSGATTSAVAAITGVAARATVAGGGSSSSVTAIASAGACATIEPVTCRGSRGRVDAV